MNISELIGILEKVKSWNPDAKVLTRTAIGTLIEAHRLGTVKVVPTHSGYLLPGNEWRQPINSKDEPDVKREVHFLISL